MYYKLLWRYNYPQPPTTPTSKIPTLVELPPDGHYWKSSVKNAEESGKGKVPRVGFEPTTDPDNSPLWTVVLGLQPHSLACRVLSIALFMVRLSYLGSLRAVLGINISLSGFELQLQQVQSLLNSPFLADNIRAFAKSNISSYV